MYSPSPSMSHPTSCRPLRPICAASTAICRSQPSRNSSVRSSASSSAMASTRRDLPPAKMSNQSPSPRNQRKEEIMGGEPHKQARVGTREHSVLAMLRALVPQRQLTPSETLRVAELQANRLLRHFRIETSSVPEEIVSELPRIRVVREKGLP